ncbi:hypothetical protein C0J52_06813 [Blattella germanica]|nr:hypothetical protein C0J52_06813 [Blattella germanica]
MTSWLGPRGPQPKTDAALLSHWGLDADEVTTNRKNKVSATKRIHFAYALHDEEP